MPMSYRTTVRTTVRMLATSLSLAILLPAQAADHSPAPAKPAGNATQVQHGKAADPAQAAATAMQSARVFFVEPADNAVVTSPFTVRFGAENVKVAPLAAPAPGIGHHHLIIDGEPVPQGSTVPANDTHIHFGKGQTETMLKLPPGRHTLTMQFADGLHNSYGPALSSTITVEVKDPNGAPAPEREKGSTRN